MEKVAIKDVIQCLAINDEDVEKVKKEMSVLTDLDRSDLKNLLQKKTKRA